MKMIGLVGGTSWQSTVEYYRILNETVNQRLGGHYSCRCIIDSLEFEELHALGVAGHWDQIGDIIIGAAQRLEQAGADLVLLTANTMHMFYEHAEAAIQVPMLHITDATAASIRAQGLTKVGLLGTKPTMEGTFIQDRLARAEFGIEALVPEPAERERVHQVIYDELVFGKTTASARREYLAIIEHLQSRGAQGVILGCTEIPLLIREADCTIPLFNTTRLHAEAAVAWALV